MIEEIKKILNSDRTHTILSHLSERKKLGWEKWIQYELAYALTELGEPEVEVRFAFDKSDSVALRHSKNTNGYIDVVFRKPHQRRNLFSALEIKLGKSDRIVRSLFVDLLKVAACNNNHWQYRSVTALGIVLGSGVRNTKFSKATQDLMDSGHLQTDQIEGTDFKLLSLKWSEQPRNATKDKFRTWLKEIEEILNNNSVQARKSKPASPSIP